MNSFNEIQPLQKVPIIRDKTSVVREKKRQKKQRDEDKKKDKDGDDHPDHKVDEFI